jgi:hypothetical protein
MKKCQAESTEIKQTATLLVIAYLDVAILGGTALIAHWVTDPSQIQRSQAAEHCSADTQNRYRITLDKPVALPDAIGSEGADSSPCYDDPSKSRR